MQIFQTEIDSGIVSYRIRYNDCVVSNEDFILYLQHSVDFVEQYSLLLATSPWAAYFWEVKPFSVEKQQEMFSFVLVKSTLLASSKLDYTAFAPYFDTEEDVIAIKNIKGDATLVIPRPIMQGASYEHLAAFVRTAPREQLLRFWQLVGRTCEAAISEQPFWLSTAGLGVSCLHVRLDTRPKYYRYAPYKMY